MTTEEVKEVIEKTVDRSSRKYYWRYIVITCLLSISSVYVTEYFRTKGQNLATKQDIQEITEKVEQVKSHRELKHKALLASLNLIDAYFSHTLSAPNVQPPTKQFATIEEARSCHNNLILTCENPKIIQLFMEIMFPAGKYGTPPTDLLNQYRNLVRKELGFGSELHLDRDRAWVNSVNFDKTK